VKLREVSGPFQGFLNTSAYADTFHEVGIRIPSSLRIQAHRRIKMSFVAWIVLGLISGFIASKIVNKSGEGVVMDIVLGIVGAVVGGWLFDTFGHMGVTGVNLYSILVAVVGAVIVLFIYHALVGNRARV
jgi:uncharacterized membrane protein YeaQ/YmgE (transglycosylase-associated protein family)